MDGFVVVIEGSEIRGRELSLAKEQRRLNKYVWT